MQVGRRSTLRNRWLASEKRFFIFKLHGDVEDLQTIVLTKRDYRDIINSSEAYRTALSQILATRTALFIGYGLRDYDLNLVLSEQASLFKLYNRRHYALLPDPGTILPKAFLEHYNVTVIPYSSKKQHAQLETLVSGLAKLVKPAQRPNEGQGPREIRKLMEIEREYCRALDTHIEQARARFLRDEAWSFLTAEDQQLVSESLEFWEEKEVSVRNTEAALRQSQKMEAIGQLAGGIAHDFNNLLAVIRGNAELALSQAEQLGPSEALDCVKEVIAAGDRAAALTRQLLAFSRKQVMQPVPVKLNEVVGNLAQMLKRLIGEDIDLDFQYAAELPRVQADIGMIEQVLVNLVVNARDAMPKGGCLTIKLSAVDVDLRRATEIPEARPGLYVRLSVADTGCGISEEVLPHVFEPFFTTKEVGKGSGLGLSTVYGIVRMHSGWIDVESKVGRGTTVHVLLPTTRAVAMPVPEDVDPNNLRGNETILLVEDDAPVRFMISGVLRKHGYQVTEAPHGPAALNAWKASSGAFDVLVTDMIMPQGMSGYELSLLLLRESPKLAVIYMSGYAAELTKADSLSLDYHFLQKPFAHRQLLRVVRSAIEARTSQQR